MRIPITPRKDSKYGVYPYFSLPSPDLEQVPSQLFSYQGKGDRVFRDYSLKSLLHLRVQVRSFNAWPSRVSVIAASVTGTALTSTTCRPVVYALATNTEEVVPSLTWHQTSAATALAHIQPTTVVVPHLKWTLRKSETTTERLNRLVETLPQTHLGEGSFPSHYVIWGPAGGSRASGAPLLPQPSLRRRLGHHDPGTRWSGHER